MHCGPFLKGGGENDNSPLRSLNDPIKHYKRQSSVQGQQTSFSNSRITCNVLVRMIKLSVDSKIIFSNFIAHWTAEEQ